LGPVGLWSGLHFSRYVHRSDGENVAENVRFGTRNVASIFKGIAGLWSLSCRLILWTDLIYASIIHLSIRAPECNVCHSVEYNKGHMCLRF
jgi:hypothetical protein